jgi:hypothetical protein
MVLATHLIKVKGTFDPCKWTEEKLREFVKQKILKLDPSFHTRVELFQIQGNDIDVWIHIFGYPSEVSEFIIAVWIGAYLKEDGIEVKKFKFKLLWDATKPLPRRTMIRLP